MEPPAPFFARAGLPDATPGEARRSARPRRPHAPRSDPLPRGCPRGRGRALPARREASRRRVGCSGGSCRLRTPCPDASDRRHAFTAATACGKALPAPMSRLSGPAPRPPTRAALALRRVHRRRLAGTARDPAVAVTGSTPTDPACPFCDPPAGQLFYQGDLVIGLWDRLPVSPGHALLIPRRHVSSWFSASDAERGELLSAVDHARIAIERAGQPDGYNIGVNVGEAAGQTVFHLHLHVIPRYRRDVANPRGGIRHVVPSKASYPGEAHEALRQYRVPEESRDPRTAFLTEPPHWRALVQGGD